MVRVQVNISRKDKMVGAMVRGLAYEVGQTRAVKDAKDDFLEKNGYYLFTFPNAHKAEQFKHTVRDYLPGCLAATEE